VVLSHAASLFVPSAVPRSQRIAIDGGCLPKVFNALPLRQKKKCKGDLRFPQEHLRVASVWLNRVW
jgi:hypothetical protein